MKNLDKYKLFKAVLVVVVWATCALFVKYTEAASPYSRIASKGTRIEAKATSKSIKLPQVTVAMPKSVTPVSQVAKTTIQAPTQSTVGVTHGRFSDDKKALVDMAKNDKKIGGITPGDMQAYKDLNKELSNPFPTNKVRGPESHPNRSNGKELHGHVGPVNHISIKNK